MARNLRTAVNLASNALAGPSRPIARPIFANPHAHLARRTFLNNFLPSWVTSKRDAVQVKPTSETTDASSSDVTTLQGKGTIEEPTVLSGDSEGIFSEAVEERFEALNLDTKSRGVVRRKYKEHWYTSARKKISPKKLKLLAHQIQGLPIDEAILQMQFSVKTAAKWIKPNLVLAKQHAIWYKHLDSDRLVVSEAIVNKDIFGPKQLDIKGRGRFGIKRHPYCRLKFVLREGKTMEEIVAIRFKKDVNKHARSAGLIHDWRNLSRKTNSGWAW